MEKLNEKIKRLRKHSGLTQLEVANAMGIKQSSYANIESGKTKNITIESGKGLAKILNVDFYTLFGIESLNDDKEKQLREIQQTVDQLSEELENYKILIQTLKRLNKAAVAKRRKENEGEYKFISDEDLPEILDSWEQEEKEAFEQIEKDPSIRRCLEQGLITGGPIYNVWKKHFQKDKP